MGRFEEEEERFWSSGDKKDLQKWIDIGVLDGLFDEYSGGVIGFINEFHTHRIISILNLFMKEHTPAVGGKLYVGDMGESTVVENNSKDPRAIEVFLVHEEDGSLTWQLIPKENLKS